jgi:predicted nucleic acid-binding protein
MTILVDSNILVFLASVQSPVHQQAWDVIRELKRRGEALHIIAQNLIEFWAVATRPVNYRGLGMNTAQAQAELTRIKSLFTLLPDDPAIYPEWERLVVRHDVAGKNVHDARIAAAMAVHGLTTLLTANKQDFKRFANLTIIEPADVIAP